MAGRLLSALSGLLVAASSLAAQIPDSIRPLPLEPIEVTAVREGAVAPPVVTIDVQAEEIRQSQAKNPYDLVRRLAGIEVHEHGQGPGFAADAVLRGFTSDHSSDVLLVVDGIPINLPVHGHVEGYADWYMLAPPALREMRVIHGPASPLYGNFAFGGVVEAHMDVDDDGSSGWVGSSSDGDLSGWVRMGSRGEDGGYLVVADGGHIQGWRDHSAYSLGNGVLRGWRRLGPGRLEGGASIYGSSWDSPGFLTVEQYNDGDLERAVDPTDGGEAHRALLHARYTAAIGTGGFQATIWGQEARSVVFLNLPEDGVLEQSEERDARLGAGARAQVMWEAGPGDVTLGAQLRRDAARYNLYATEARERVSPTTDLDGDYGGYSLFGRWQARLTGRLLVDLGARLDGLSYSSTDDLEESSPPAGISSIEWLPSPKLGTQYELSGSLTGFASYSRGFRSAPGVFADPLRPAMTVWAGELGLEAQVRSLVARVAAFHLAVSNERIQDPVTREISDAGASVRQGFSLDATWTMTPRATLSGSFTFNDAFISEEVQFPELRVTEPAPGAAPAGASHDPRPPHPPAPRARFHVTPLAPGDPVPNVARYTGRVTIGALVGDETELRAAWRFSGPFSPIGEPNVRTQAYGLLDLGASLALPLDEVTLDLELENLFDVKYPEVRSSGFINPGPPRTLRAALRFGAGPVAQAH